MTTASPNKPDLKSPSSRAWINSLRPYVAAGEEQQLIVHLELNQPFKFIFAVIKGKEKAGATVNGMYKFMKCKIFKSEVKLPVMEGFTGYMTIPLNLNLPLGIPNSFNYKANGSSFSVRYSVRIQADNQILTKNRFIVYTPMATKIVTPQQKCLENVQVSGLLPWKKNTVKMEIDPESRVYEIGETARFNLTSQDTNITKSQNNIYGGLFVIITGKGPFKDFNLTIPRCETPKDNGAKSPFGISVTILPSFMEQETDTSMFRTSYSLGVLINNNSRLFKSVPIGINWIDHVPSGKIPLGITLLGSAVCAEEIRLIIDKDKNYGSAALLGEKGAKKIIEEKKKPETGEKLAKTATLK